MSKKDGRFRKHINPGSSVQIVLKEDQQSGHLTKGVVEEILTGGAKHPHGIKVLLRSGKVGRVKKILSSKKERKVMGSLKKSSVQEASKKESI